MQNSIEIISIASQSPMNLASHFSKVDWAGTISEQFNNQLPSGLYEQDLQTYDESNEELEMETEGASDWLLREDIVQIIGIAVGFFLFILVIMSVVYLKCKKRGGSALMVPYFQADTQSVNIHRGGFGQNNSYTQFSQPQPDVPTGPLASETTPNSTASAPPVISHKSLERKLTKQQSSLHTSKRGKRSLVAENFRTK